MRNFFKFVKNFSLFFINVSKLRKPLLSSVDCPTAAAIFIAKWEALFLPFSPDTPALIDKNMYKMGTIAFNLLNDRKYNDL